MMTTAMATSNKANTSLPGRRPYAEDSIQDDDLTLRAPQALSSTSRHSGSRSTGTKDSTSIIPAASGADNASGMASSSTPASQNEEPKAKRLKLKASRVKESELGKPCIEPDQPALANEISASEDVLERSITIQQTALASVRADREANWSKIAHLEAELEKERANVKESDAVFRDMSQRQAADQVKIDQARKAAKLWRQKYENLRQAATAVTKGLTYEIEAESGKRGKLTDGLRNALS